MQFRLADL